MNFKNWFRLQEMPMQINKVGDWDYDPTNVQGSNYTWNTQSLKMLGNQRAIDKIVRRLESVPHDFNVYLIKGEKSPNTFGGQRVPLQQAESFYKRYEIDPQQAPIMPDKINVFFVGWNDEPPTAWMMVHRFAHAASFGFIDEMEQATKVHIQAPEMSGLQLMVFQGSLTMASARNHRVNNLNEGFREVLTQYIMTNKVTLKKPPGKWANYIQDIPAYQEKLTQICKNVMDESKQYIHIM